MQNIFLDTNILIDFFADRKPFSTEAAKLFSYSFKKKINIYISAVSYNNIYYILRQSFSPDLSACCKFQKIGIDFQLLNLFIL